MSTFDKSNPHYDTRDGIFKRTFHVKLPYIETLSVEEIQMHGMPRSGDAALDRAVAYDLVDRYITINEMVEYMRRGVVIRVVHYETTKDIYNCIEDHLLAWKDELITQRSANYAPLEDLIDLDKLAKLVYDKAKYVFSSHNATDFITKNLSELFGGEPFGVTDGLSGFEFGLEGPVAVESEDNLGNHQSLESLFVSRMSR